LKKPCSALTRGQKQHLHTTIKLESRTKPDFSLRAEPACDLKGGEAHQVGGSWSFLTDGYGLAGPYSYRSDYEVFKPLRPIHGYPAAIAMTTDGRDSGRCGLIVGVSDKLIVNFELVTGLNPSAKPCAVTKKVAAAAVATMKKEAGS
jgi:hypothetical protein